MEEMKIHERMRMIDDMLEQVKKEIEEAKNADVETQNEASDNIYSSFIGKYVICRSSNEGVNAGKVINLDDTAVILEDARRLWSHIPLDTTLSWYEGIAISGLDSSSKISNEVKKLIVEDYSLTLCTSKAEQSIREAKTNAQS